MTARQIKDRVARVPKAYLLLFSYFLSFFFFLLERIAENSSDGKSSPNTYFKVKSIMKGLVILYEN